MLILFGGRNYFELISTMEGLALPTVEFLEEKIFTENNTPPPPNQSFSSVLGFGTTIL